MSIFDTLGQMMGGQQGGQDGQPGLGAGGQAGMVGAVVQMIQNHPGGVQGLVQSFEQNGLGGAVQSWMSPGANQAVSPDQVQDALGPDAVGQVAQNMGVSQDEAAGHLSQLLPMIMGHLGNAGAAGGDQGGGMGGGGLGGLMGMLGGLNKG